MSNPRYFYKYREFNSITLESIFSNTIYYSPPGNFNDPLDCEPLIISDSTTEELLKLLEFFTEQRMINEFTEHLKKAKVLTSTSLKNAKQLASKESTKLSKFIQTLEINKKALKVGGKDNLLIPIIQNELRLWYQKGVHCLSTKYDCPLMWSHYGDHHKGICIGYKASNVNSLNPQQIEYGGDRAIKTSELCAAFLKNDLYYIALVERRILLKKAEGWQYEGEWRFIGTPGEKKSPLKIDNITFGLKCPAAAIHSVMASMDKLSYEIKYYKIHTDNKSFDLIRKSQIVDQY